MKKFLVFSLAALLTISLAACGGNGDTNNGDQGNGDTNGSQVTDDGEGSLEPEGDITFEDSLKAEGIYENYYFEMEVNVNGEDFPTSQLWFLGGDMKFENQDQAIFIKPSEEQMGIYTKETNQMVLMPISENEDFYTPFTAAEEIEEEVYEGILYKGSETLDGKTVDVFEYDAMDVYAKYYIWRDTGIIVKMIVHADEYESEYYFKNMRVNELTADDLAYPEDAEIMDMSEFLVQ